MKRLIGIRCLACLALPGVLDGCDREEVTFMRVPKEPPRPGSMIAQPPARIESTEQAVLEWTVPAGWKPMPQRPMRYATFAVTDDNPPAELAVFLLQRRPLLETVNLWQQQLGLKPSLEEDLSDVVRRLDAGNVQIDMVDLAGQGHPRLRILGAVVTHGDRTWVFRLAGPTEQLQPVKPVFEQFLRSIRFPAPSSQPSAAGLDAGLRAGPLAIRSPNPEKLPWGAEGRV